MPKLSATESFELTTRDRHTKAECEVTIKIDGREIPTNAIVGAALDKCVVLLQEHVTESYAVIPERV